MTRDLFAPWHIIILAVVLVVLFGARKLPESARAVGRALRIFKAEVKGLHEDDVAAEPVPPPAQLPPVTPVVVSTSSSAQAAATDQQPGPR